MSSDNHSLSYRRPHHARAFVSTVWWQIIPSDRAVYQTLGIRRGFAVWQCAKMRFEECRSVPNGWQVKTLRYATDEERARI